MSRATVHVLIAAAAIVLGVVARFAALDRPFYFHDEAVTSLRVSGETAADFKRFVGGRSLTFGQIQRFQEPGDGVAATVRSLAVDDPQHPPLYFVLARAWAGLAGASVTSMRAFSSMLGVVALVASAWLAWELFGSAATTMTTAAFFAVSPFQILYAREAREYGLWAALVAVSSALLVIAVRDGRIRCWIGYAAATAASLYTFPNTALIVAGHCAFVVLHRPSRPVLARMAGAVTAAVLAYLPWLAVIVAQRGAFDAGTSWLKASTPLRDLVRSWVVVGALGIVDRAGGISSPSAGAIVVGAATIGVEALAFVVLWRTAGASARLMLTILLAAPVIPLAAADLTEGGIRSAVPRYLTPAYLAVTLAVAHLVACGMASPRRRRRGVAALTAVAVLFAAAASYARRANAAVWWNADDGAAAANVTVARLLRAGPRPFLVNTGIGTLLELNHYVPASMRFNVPLDGRMPRPPRGSSAVYLYGSPANGTAAARLLRVREDLRRRGGLAAPIVVPPPCCGAGIHGLPEQLWRVVRLPSATRR